MTFSTYFICDSFRRPILFKISGGFCSGRKGTVGKFGPNANLNSASIENYEIILRDIFKYALNVNTRTFNSFDCELMDLYCRNCKAKYFESEVT